MRDGELPSPEVGGGLHPRHGPHNPRTRAQDLAPGAVRRTTSIDMLRPDGLEGPLQLIGRGSDTTHDGDVIATAALEATVAFVDGRRLTAISVTPTVPGLDALLGLSAASGFRAHLLDLDLDQTSLEHQLLDDVPTTVLVSGYATQAGGPIPTIVRRSKHHFIPDQCAGWVSGGSIMVEIDAYGAPPVVTGPPRPPAADTEGLPELPPHGMRRQRRTDVHVVDGEIRVTSWFRDSHMSAEGRPTVIHEYDVELTAAVETGVVRTATAVARSLPWVECPSAVSSAGRLVGRNLADLRADVRRELTGIGTCTHLNDQLRSLADVPALASNLRGAVNAPHG
ncbi:MAG TPA: DUF2889 domain-containing protein [Mycobacteriales bacterium]|nr:DUF2889 domain-containing protein [Mycobacteriales bacterium]